MTEQFEKFLLERVLHRIDHGERSPSWPGTLVLWIAAGLGSFFLFSGGGASRPSVGAIAVGSFVFGAFAAHGIARIWQSLWWPFVVRYIDSTAIRARLAQLQA
ncbi:hypothetical protein [Pseudoxanthomonas sp. PXM01]|uniref:hypothetical protein n=1 Tax=Pseudoxanthomonas sp. PXM01 TaxID=2769295 RepID=UPI00177F2C95|nr:hypothetical protein [Pseudoxanthomonas sp. PXM01]MBD9469214.1 hypothetical protein [Pseudoxanthomonas sp. PXM01]